MKRRNYIQLAVIALLLILSTVILFSKTMPSNLFSYDPYIHLLLTKNSIETESINENIPSCFVDAKTDYTSNLRVLTVLLTLITGLDPLFFYKILGAIFFVFCGIFIFLFAREKSYNFASLGFIVMISVIYLGWRGLITYPEGMVFLFFVAMIRYLDNKSKYAITLFIILVVASIFTHERSFFMPALLSLAFIIKNKIPVKKILLTTLFVLLALLPLTPILLTQVQGYWQNHIGIVKEAGFKEIDPDTSRYRNLEFKDYQNNLGIILLIFSPLAIIYLMIKNPKEYWHLVFLSLVFFFITLGQRVGLYIPAYRAYSYLALPLIFLISVYLPEQFKGKKWTFITIIALLVTFSVINLSEVRGAKLVSDFDFQAIDYMKNKDYILVSLTPHPEIMGLSDSECRVDKVREILLSKDKKSLEEIIKKEYGNNKVALYIKYSSESQISELNPEFLKIISSNEVLFANQEVKIIKIK